MAQSKSYRLRSVDVFSTQRLLGNPLAVVFDGADLSAEAMQAIAREMNLSETTFVLPAQMGGTARVRIFTPHAELPFAGHPTIGTAWVLLDEGLVPEPANELTLEEGIGLVSVRVERSPQGTVLWMTHRPVQFGEILKERDQVAAALGLPASDLAPDVPIQVASTGLPFVYVALKDARAVDGAISSEERLTSVLEPLGLPPVLLFTRVDGRHLYSRMFGPHSSTRIIEDPATGAASGALGAFAVRYGLVSRAATVEIVSEQGTKMGRQSMVHIKLSYAAGAQSPDLIEVGGSVVPVISGTISLGR